MAKQVTKTSLGAEREAHTINGGWWGDVRAINYLKAVC